MNHFDQYISRIRDRIEDNIADQGGEGRKVIMEYNSKVEINNNLNLLDEILKRYMEEKYGMESNF